MTEARRRTSATVLVGLAVCLAACGGGSSRLSKSHYEQKLKAEASTLQAAFASLNLQTTDLKALASRVGTVQQKLQQAGDDVAKLKPPQNAEADNTKIARALHEFAKTFGQLKQAAAAGSLSKVSELRQRIERLASQGTEATRDLQSKGYDVGGFAG